MREDRNVLDLMTADYTFVNERLAQHYGIPDVYGSQFRRVTLTDDARRGLLGKGAILMVTSHAHRTSPVLRGKWMLENIVGVAAAAAARRRAAARGRGRGPRSRDRCASALEQHRANPACASCHRVMDPIGFALENFDAVGAWRDARRRHARRPVDASGQLADGTTVDGVVALRQALLRDPETFVRTMTEKLLTYAVGRGLDLGGHAGGAPHRAGRARPRTTGSRRWFSASSAARRSRCGRRWTRRWLPPRGPRATRGDSSTDSLQSEQGAYMFITQDVVVAPDGPARMGATLALPFLDAMVPAVTALAKTAAQPARRFGAVFVPMGERPGYWTPKTTGAGFEFSPILKPLERFRDELVVVSNLDRPPGGTHAVSTATWLTGSAPKRTEAEDFFAGMSLDQMVAGQIGEDTVFPSLEIATEDQAGYIGACDVGYSCAYMSTIAWKRPTTPLPMEMNPRVVFERMFGRPGSAADRLARMQARSEHPRLGEAGRRVARARARARATACGSANISSTCARSSSGFSAPSTRRHASSRCRTRRSAFRRRSKSTSACCSI